MRGECKYAHECRYQRYVDGKECIAVRTECWAVKEPFECDEGYRELCGIYRPLSSNAKLSWIQTDEFDDYFGYVFKCARCGKEIIGTSNYCPHCGYEYNPWDVTTFK